jgi:carboxymethylenebutenolidase
MPEIFPTSTEESPMPNITLTAKDGHKLGAYTAKPQGKPKGALVVLQEIFGVNHHMRNVADWFAKEGYSVVAPALFDRVKPGIELGYTPPDIEEGRNIRGKIALEDTLLDLQAAIDEAGKGGLKVGVVGYCWGGGLAYLAATRLNGVSAAVGYYGGLVAAHAGEKTRAPVILHFGETDQSIPMSDVEKVKKAHPDMSIFTYPSGHGFACDERGSYNEADTKLANERTLKFFGEKLR